MPDDLEASAAAELIRDGISSILDGLRGLRRLRLNVHGGAAQQRSLSVTIASTDSELHIYSPLGVTAGRLLAEKTPGKVREVKFGFSVSPQERRSVLEGLGVEREVGSVTVGDFDWDSLGTGEEVSLAEGPFDGWASDSFPSIDNIDIGLRGTQCTGIEDSVWPILSVHSAVCLLFIQSPTSRSPLLLPSASATASHPSSAACEAWSV